MHHSGGRKLHNYWSDGGFIPIKMENGRIGALCGECSNILKNTTKSRLQAHRRICVATSTETNAKTKSLSDIINLDINASEGEMMTIQSVEGFEIAQQAFTDGIEIAEDSLTATIFTSESSSLNHISISPSSSRRTSPSPLPTTSASTSISRTSPFPSPSTSASTSISRASPSPLLSTSASTSSSNVPTRKEFTSPNPNPKKKVRKVPNINQISKFIDSMDGMESSKIDLALAKFFYACNIPFAVVESDWFLAFVRMLRPAYKPPSRKNLAGKLLDTVYLEVKEEVIKTETEGVLLIDGWKNSNNNTHNVLTIMRTIEGKKVFVESFDFTNISETGEELVKACQESIKICKEKFNSTIYGVISDNAKNMLKMGRLLKEDDTDLMHVTCNSHTGNLLAKEMANKKLNEDVVKVQRFFKNHSGLEKKIVDCGGKRVRLPIDVRWCTYRNCFENFLYNLNHMKKLAAEDMDKKIATDVKQLLFDDNFIQAVEEEIYATDPVCKLINKCQDDATLLSEAAHLWLQLKVPEKYEKFLRARKEMALSIDVIAAYTLDPRYVGRDLSVAQHNEVTLHFINIFSSGELNDYDKFIKGQGIFGILNKKMKEGGEKDMLLPRTYWSLASKEHPGISKYAMRLLSIPASSAAIERVFSEWSFVHTKVRNRLSQEHSKKLIDIHYNLKMIDKNKTDEY